MFEVAGGILLVILILATLFNIDVAFAVGKLFIAFVCAVALVAIVAKTLFGV